MGPTTSSSLDRCNGRKAVVRQLGQTAAELSESGHSLWRFNAGKRRGFGPCPEGFIVGHEARPSFANRLKSRDFRLASIVQSALWSCPQEPEEERYGEDQSQDPHQVMRGDVGGIISKC